MAQYGVFNIGKSEIKVDFVLCNLVFEIYNIMEMDFLGEEDTMRILEFRVIYLKKLHSNTPSVKK